MNNLYNKIYNKIYNAVNEGIQKALLIDPDQNDVSINYSYSKIDNSIDPLLLKFVDLGLPSGTLWCDRNVGATCKNTSTSWYGNYYAWGESKSKEIYNFDHYTFNGKIINSDNDIAYIAYSETSNSRIAKSVCMPTKNQLRELKNNTNEKWVTDYNGIKGLNGEIFSSKINDNFIFIPAADFYIGKELNNGGPACRLWTKSINLNDYNNAWCLAFNQYSSIICEANRADGFSVRGVCPPIKLIIK